MQPRLATFIQPNKRTTLTNFPELGELISSLVRLKTAETRQQEEIIASILEQDAFEWYLRAPELLKASDLLLIFNLIIASKSATLMNILDKHKNVVNLVAETLDHQLATQYLCALLSFMTSSKANAAATSIALSFSHHWIEASLIDWQQCSYTLYQEIVIAPALRIVDKNIFIDHLNNLTAKLNLQPPCRLIKTSLPPDVGVPSLSLSTSPPTPAPSALRQQSIFKYEESKNAMLPLEDILVKAEKKQAVNSLQAQ